MADGLVPYCQPSRTARSRNRPEIYEILSLQECLMKLRHNEYCPIHRSLSCCGRELTHRARSSPCVRRVEDPHHPRWIPGTSIARGNAQTPKAEGQGTERNMRNLSSRVHRLQRHHARPSGSEGDGGLFGEMIIRTIFKQHIGGAMGKKDQPEWMTDGRSVERRFLANGPLQTKNLRNR
jgi:hypothetical protein